MQISPEITCFVFCKNEVSGELEDQLSDALKIHLKRIDSLDDMLANRLLMTKNGCVVIAGDEQADAATDFVNFFLIHHVWLPVVSFVPSEQPSRYQRGIFATTNTLSDLKQRVIEALQCDLSGGYPPAELRRNTQRLTPREQEAINLFLQGLNTKAVAKVLGITYQTVDKHRGRALKKFGVATVVDLQLATQRTMLASMGIPVEPARKNDSEHVAPAKAMVPTPHFFSLPVSLPPANEYNRTN